MTQFLTKLQQYVSGDTLPIRINQKVELFFSDPLGQKLKVFSGNPDALRIDEKACIFGSPFGLRRFEVTALKDSEDVPVWATSDTAGLNVVDSVEFNVLDSTELGAHYRGKVIEIARSMLGCHYLWGAAGATPGQQDGMPLRRGSVVMFDPAKHKGAAKGDVMNHVAVCQVDGFNTCAGRAQELNPPGTYRADPRFTLSEADKAQESDTRSWRTVYKSYKDDHRRGTILGETCENVRHFDCIGFINYCLSLALGEPIQWTISGTKKHKNTGLANQVPKLSKADDDLPGDILIYLGKRGTEEDIDVAGKKSKKKVIVRASHIAFSLGYGKGRIHASETERGVVTDPGLGSPIRRVRYPKLA